QGPPGDNGRPGRRRPVRGGQGGRRPGPPHRAVPVPAVLRGRAVHGHRREVHAARRDHRFVQGTGRGGVRPLARAGLLHGRRDRGGRGAGQEAGVGRGRGVADVATPFDVYLVTPERELWSGQATMVVARGTEG